MKKAALCIIVLLLCCISFWGGLSTNVFSDVVSGELLVSDTIPETDQQSPGFGSSRSKQLSQHKQDGNRSLGGVFQSQGVSIHWAGSDPLDERARPVDVIEAVLERVQAEQKTDLGSDGHARAMISLQQAIESLQGTSESTPDGPVIR